MKIGWENWMVKWARMLPNAPESALLIFNILSTVKYTIQKPLGSTKELDKQYTDRLLLYMYFLFDEIHQMFCECLLAPEAESKLNYVKEKLIVS